MTIFWLSIMKNTGLIFLIIKYLMYINEKMFAALDFFFLLSLCEFRIITDFLNLLSLN